MIRESTNETDVKKARAKLKAKQDEIAAARGGYTTLPGPEVKTTTVQTLLDAFVSDCEVRKVRSLKSIKSYVAHVARRFGSWKAIDVTEVAIETYVADRVKAGHAPSSINHSTQVLRQALRRSWRSTAAPSPRSRSFRKPTASARRSTATPRPRPLSRRCPRISRTSSGGALVRLEKGGNRSLKWADVDRDAGTIRLSLRKSKNGKARTIALAGELLRIIERRWAARTIATKSGATLLSTLVFHRGEGRGKYQGQAQPVGDFDKVFKTACAAAGIPTAGRRATRSTAADEAPPAGCAALASPRPRSWRSPATGPGRCSTVQHHRRARHRRGDAQARRLRPDSGREQRDPAPEGPGE